MLGNVLDIPKGVPMWQAFAHLAQKFNTDVLYLKLLNKDLVILNSYEAVSDLCDKRSNIYSGRPWAPVADLMGLYSWNMGFMEYGDQLKNCRRLLHEFLNPRAVVTFDEYQREHAYNLLSRLVESPDDFFDHVQFTVGALIMEMTYGINIATREDKYLQAVEVAMDGLKRAAVPGAFLVDTIPILRYIPEWFPGAGFKTFARVAREKFNIAVDGPLEHVKELIKSNGSGKASIAWSYFERSGESTSQAYDEDIIRAAVGTMYLAAVETTSAVLQAFFLAMALNPHVVQKAQEELDRVLGGERLPDFSDKEALPYISAIIKEVLRWGYPAPISGPKRAMEDDVYNGYFIPAGATIIENVWAIFYDESIYPAPHTYDPERYLKDGELDPFVNNPEERIFGSGRRICPGEHFAMRTLFLNIACILALFNVEAPIGADLEAKFFGGGVIVNPLPFKCTITPRSEASLKLLRSACAAADH